MTTTTGIFRISGWRLDRSVEWSLGPVDLEVGPGELLTCMGPSGVGKTTLLLSLLGYQQAGLAQRGERFDGERLLSPGEIPKGALLIPQGLPFNPNWEVASFLRHLCRGKHAREIVARALEEMGLTHRAHATVAELSGGEAQRAGLAQMLVLGANNGKLRLVVADEPASALDPGMARWVHDRFRAIVRERNCGAILSMHDVHGALYVSTRVAFIWPPLLGLTPWIIRPGSAFWDPDSLHTLLCIARWASGSVDAPAVRDMLSTLKGEVERPGLQAPTAHGLCREYLVDRAAPTADATRLALVTESRITETQWIAPVRLLIGSQRNIGVVRRVSQNVFRVLVVEGLGGAEDLAS